MRTFRSTEILSEIVTGIERSGSDLMVSTDHGSHEARAGHRLRRPHPQAACPRESELEHQGVATCADCDGPMYQDQTVVGYPGLQPTANWRLRR